MSSGTTYFRSGRLLVILLMYVCMYVALINLLRMRQRSSLYKAPAVIKIVLIVSVMIFGVHIIWRSPIKTSNFMVIHNPAPAFSSNGGQLSAANYNGVKINAHRSRDTLNKANLASCSMAANPFHSYNVTSNNQCR